MMEDGLKSVMDKVLNAVRKILEKTDIKSIVNSHLQKEYDQGAEAVEVQFDFNSKRNEKNLDTLQDYTFDNIKDMNEEIANKMRKELQEASMNLETVDQMKDRVRKIMNVGENRIKAIANTELGRAENFGRLDAAKDSPLLLKKYLIMTDDNRTSQLTREFNKKYGTPEQAIELDEAFWVIYKGKEHRGQAPPFHPHDRDVVEFTQAIE